MRATILLLAIVIISGCASSKIGSGKGNKLNGDWIPVSQEIGGNPLPPAAFEKQKLIISDSNYTVIAESIDKGILKFSEEKIDITGKEGVNTGKHFTAIYKLENEVLTICYNLKGTEYPTLLETKGKPLYFLSVFKREGTRSKK